MVDRFLNRLNAVRGVGAGVVCIVLASGALSYGGWFGWITGPALLGVALDAFIWTSAPAEVPAARRSTPRSPCASGINTSCETSKLHPLRHRSDAVFDIMHAWPHGRSSARRDGSPG